MLMEYVFMALSYVCKTPIWDDPWNNISRTDTIKTLMTMTRTAIINMKKQFALTAKKRALYTKQ